MSTIPLRDGRNLAYAEFGDRRGKPVFFFHGTPGSRIFHPPDEITTKLGVRLVTTDRPGYGESTFQPGRRILDWPNDIAQLADTLGMDQFSVIGHSGGGPYALACAYALPGRICAAALLSSAGPVDALEATADMILINRIGFKYGKYIPWALFRILVWWIFHERITSPAKAMERETGHRPTADEELMSRPEVKQMCVECEEEGFRHGMLGFAWDMRLVTRPWGFSLENVDVPVYLWHGTCDNVTSISMARHIASRLPHCHAKYCDGEAHMLLISHWEEIFRTLIAA